MTRKVLKDMTLLDGTFLPKDTVIVVATDPAHYDDDNYTNANPFDPFRFARMREADGEDTKHQLVNTSLEYMPFGHGKHAWCAPSVLRAGEKNEPNCCHRLRQPRSVLRSKRNEGDPCVHRS